MALSQKISSNKKIMNKLKKYFESSHFNIFLYECHQIIKFKCASTSSSLCKICDILTDHYFFFNSSIC